MLALFRCLLHLYPANFFREFSQEMFLCFQLRLQELRHQSWTRRASFVVREFWGAFTGAMSEQLGCRFDDLFRRFDMGSFRFSRFAMVSMILALAGVLIAIETTVSTAMMQFDSDSVVEPGWSALGRLGYFPLIMAILGTIGYGALRVGNKSAGERLANIRTWPQERQSPRH